jgi:hypothetical protein
MATLQKASFALDKLSPVHDQPNSWGNQAMGRPDNGLLIEGPVMGWAGHT